MADKPNVEESGAGENANSSVSPETVAGNADQLPQLVKAAVEEALKPVKGEISGLYSRQDKDRNAFREFMDEYNKNKDKGLSDADAFSATETAFNKREQDAKKDKMIEEIYNKFVGSPSPQSGGTGVSGAVDVAQAIRDAGLDENDPKVALMMNQNFPTEEEVNKAIVGYLKAKKQAPSPTQAQTLADNTGQAVKSSHSQQELNEMNARLNKYYLQPTRYQKEIEQLEKELEPYLPK